MKILLGVLLAALALTAAASAAPDGFRESARLTPIASGVTGRPVTVWCARTPAIWRDTVVPLYPGQRWATLNGYAMVNEPATYLAPWVCQTLEGWLRGKSAPTPEVLGRRLLTLVHEAIHLRGILDEGVTDCTALSLVPGVARASFRIRSAKVLHAVVRAAQDEHNESPVKFRGSC